MSFHRFRLHPHPYYTSLQLPLAGIGGKEGIEYAIAQHRLNNPNLWKNYLTRAYPRNWQDSRLRVGIFEMTVKKLGEAHRFLRL